MEIKGKAKEIHDTLVDSNYEFEVCENKIIKYYDKNNKDIYVTIDYEKEENPFIVECVTDNNLWSIILNMDIS